MTNLITIPDFSTELGSPEKPISITKITWLKKVNDFVKNGDAICELETDRATLELESFYDGYILLTNNKTEVSYNDVLCIIGNRGESYTLIIDDYEKSRINERLKQPSYTIKNSFESLSNEKADLAKRFFKWFINLFKQ
ncbi:lipoyl domain-containing protein [Tenacibaculum amylolyticum]|uniref:lipoyl domain-containing protein n=1 Tax=Tenacibaculum amylolyticum TaxID=104269 RepID=UPI003894DFF5